MLVCQEDDEESVHANETFLSESLHYSTLMFPNGAGSEIRGLSKLTAVYAIVHHSSEQQTETGVTETAVEKVQEENKINSEEIQVEEVTYGNITRQPMEQLEFATNNDNNDDFNNHHDDDGNNKIKYTKETKEATEKDTEQHKHLKEAEDLHAFVKHK